MRPVFIGGATQSTSSLQSNSWRVVALCCLNEHEDTTQVLNKN